MRIKICGIKTEADVDVVIKSGADAAGFLVGQVHTSTDFILPSTAARLSGTLPPFITPVIVTHLVDAASILDIVKRTGITTLQLHGGSLPEDVRKICDALPGNGKIIFAVHMIKGEIAPSPDEYYPFIDAVLLDSCNMSTGQVGGTGQIHDWALSAQIARTSPVPVILAGGLSPSNVEEAVRTVKPYGVDANSGLKNPEGGRDPELCKAFVVNARRAWMNKDCSFGNTAG
ncbi:MAG: phosphoribosylanthranilate isomerase [Victivallales bacterium]|jgi:phosphoribosylanthranilate isomerase